MNPTRGTSPAVDDRIEIGPEDATIRRPTTADIYRASMRRQILCDNTAPLYRETERVSLGDGLCAIYLQRVA